MGSSCSPSHGHYGARGVWTKTVDGELLRRKLAAGKSTRPESLAISLDLKKVLHEEGITVDWILHSDGDGGGRWRLLTES
jgi:hypothetical protein